MLGFIMFNLPRWGRQDCDLLLKDDYRYPRHTESNGLFLKKSKQVTGRGELMTGNFQGYWKERKKWSACGNSQVSIKEEKEFPGQHFSNFSNFWGAGADFFKFQTQIYSMTVFKNALATYFLEGYDVSLGMMNRIKNL